MRDSEYQWLNEMFYEEEDLVDYLPIKEQRRYCSQDNVLFVQYVVAHELEVSVPAMGYGGDYLWDVFEREMRGGNPTNDLGVYFPFPEAEVPSIFVLNETTYLSVLLHEVAHHVAAEKGWDESGDGQGVAPPTKHHGPLFLKALKEVYTAYYNVSIRSKEQE